MRKNLLSLSLAAALMICGTVDASFSLGGNAFTDFIKNTQSKFSQSKNLKADKPAEEVKAGQVCKSTTYSITSLPYWDTKQTLPCMYSGTFTTDAKNNHNLFFWLVKNTALEKPNLVVWLNGGPGASSMSGLFLENGPLQVTQPDPKLGPDNFLVGLRDGAWTELADVVYIDNPVNTGFSFGDTYVSSMADASAEFVSFIDQFLTLFPEYSLPLGSNLYLTGESFGGKYLVQFGREIIRYQENQGSGKVKLAGIVMGNPLISPPVQRLTTHRVAQSLGMIDDSNMEQIATLHRECEQALSSNWDKSNDACAQVLSYIQDVSGNVLSYDARIFISDYKKITQPYEDYLSASGKITDLYKAIHIDKSTKKPNTWDKTNKKVADALNGESMFDSTNWFDITNDDVPMLIYAGMWDQREGPTTTEDWLSHSRKQAKSLTPIAQQARQIYYIKQLDGTYTVGGYMKYDSDGKLTVLTMPKAGHFAPLNQLQTTYQVLSDFLAKGTLVCHKDNPEDCQVTKTMCQFMTNCNGNGICGDSGQCTCNEGYKSADCSEKVEQLTASYHSQVTTNGTQWHYYQYQNGLAANLHYEMVFSSQMPLDIFISSGWQSDPNEFQYDLAFRQQNYIRITSKQFPNFETFTAAVKVNGIEHYSTTFHQSNLNVKFDIITDQSVLLTQESEIEAIQHQMLQSLDPLENPQNDTFINFNHDISTWIDEIDKINEIDEIDNEIDEIDDEIEDEIQKIEKINEIMKDELENQRNQSQNQSHTPDSQGDQHHWRRNHDGGEIDHEKWRKEHEGKEGEHHRWRKDHENRGHHKNNSDGKNGHRGKKHHKDDDKKPQGRMFYQVLWEKLQPIIDKIVHFDIYFPYFLAIIVFGFFYLMFFQKKQQQQNVEQKQVKEEALTV
ncbi:serine carboxypeptidase [Stylonychia lemnae]|uniref:Serine carboxypeptidase n=1 Tax=Stylonychia lemnae TaxID=5949 RepID=A0A078B1G0_STYLE|nr:serine carboxypeptidase [Stylonychia lemnae]|eukprot:CDW87058.1 serine carboxypeptidase [Stylonychia lemnae]